MTSIRLSAMVGGFALLAACNDGPTGSPASVPAPTAQTAALSIVGAGTPEIAALVANRGTDTLAIAGCVLIEERRGDAWVAVTPEGCALAEQRIMPTQSIRLGVPPTLARSAVRISLNVEAVRNGLRSPGKLALSAVTP